MNSSFCSNTLHCIFELKLKRSSVSNQTQKLSFYPGCINARDQNCCKNKTSRNGPVLQDIQGSYMVLVFFFQSLDFTLLWSFYWPSVFVLNCALSDIYSSEALRYSAEQRSIRCGQNSAEPELSCLLR